MGLTEMLNERYQLIVQSHKGLSVSQQSTCGPEQQRCCPAAAYVSVPCDMKATQLCSVVANSEWVLLRSVGLKGQTRASTSHIGRSVEARRSRWKPECQAFTLRGLGELEGHIEGRGWS